MTTTAHDDPQACVLETYEAHTLPKGPGTTHGVLVCRSHGWTSALEPGEPVDGQRATGLVAQHRAQLSGRVLHAEGGTLVIEVHDPALYAEPGLVEDLRLQFGARNVVGVDPRALHLYVTPDDDAVAAVRDALRDTPDDDPHAQATSLVGALARAGHYLVRVADTRG